MFDCFVRAVQEENAKLCDVLMRWLLGEAGVRLSRKREYNISESRRVPNTESLADRLRCCLQVAAPVLLRCIPKLSLVVTWVLISTVICRSILEQPG